MARFAPQYPNCPAADPMCDEVEAPFDPKDQCFVANQNIRRAEKQSFEEPRSNPKKLKAWDHTHRPLFLDRIDAHFHLTEAEHQKLEQNAFVVLDRLSYVDYATAFHDIFQEQLPVYVSVDPILHAVFQASEIALEGIERKRLKPALTVLLKKLRKGLAQARPGLRAETAADLDLYLGVAYGLLTEDSYDDGVPKTKVSLFGNDAQINRWLALARAREMTDPEGGIELFGRSRVVDFSQLTPRGHYVTQYGGMDSLESYFQAMMWLSRLEFNLVSRASRSSQPGANPNPEETPREAADALALAEIASTSGAFIELREFESMYSAFAGRREDVSLEVLFEVAKNNRISSRDSLAQAKLRVAIGDRFQRHARTHFMPQHSEPLPVITTMFGPRIVPDIEPLNQLVHSSIEGRYELSAADVGYVLGHDRALEYLRDDLGHYSDLRQKLQGARQLLKQNASSNDLYARWLSAIVAEADTPKGIVPSFFSRPAYQDFRMNSALVAFGQMRHVFTLMAGQGYDEYGCEIPDGYVEPLLPVWDALLGYAERLKARTQNTSGMVRVLKMLRSIVETELSGAPLSDAQRRWLAMVAESIPIGGYMDTGAPPRWTGWFFDLFEDREIGAEKTSAFVADYFTLTNLGKVKYLGADGPRLGIFVVDVGGEPRAMVGPVAKGYETESAIAQRLDDEKALSHSPKASPWRASYAESEVPAPPLGLELRLLACNSPPGKAERRFAIRAARPLGKVTLTLLDHHGDPLQPSLSLDVGVDFAVVSFELPKGFENVPNRALPIPGRSAEYGVDALDIRVNDLSVSGLGRGSFHFTTAPGCYERKDQPNPLLPTRPYGIGDLLIGNPTKASGTPGSANDFKPPPLPAAAPSTVPPVSIPL